MSMRHITPSRFRFGTSTTVAGLIAVVFLLALMAPRAAAQETVKLPPARFDPAMVKFDPLAPHETGEMEVKLINTGDKPIRFERAMGSCSCIKGTVTLDPVAPGEAATVKLTMQAIINRGIQKKQLYVFAEGYKRPITLNVQATVVDPDPIEARIKIEPEVLDVGHVAPSSSTDRIVLLRNTSDKPIQFARVSTTCTCVTGVLLDDMVAPGETARLKVTVHAKDFPGPIDRNLSVWFMGARQPLQVRVKADVSLAIKAEPFFLNLAAPVDGVIPTKGVINLTALDGRPFRVLSAGGVSPTLDPDDRDTPAVSHRVHWDLTDVPDDAMKPWWIIETDHPEAPIIDFRVIHPALIRKMVASQGPWVIAPDRVLLPNIKPAGAMERTIRLVGVKADKIESVSVESAQLSVAMIEQTKTDTGLEVTVRITASPKATGMIRTKLTIKADGVVQSAFIFARVDSSS